MIKTYGKKGPKYLLKVHTAYVERLNAALRGQLTPLVSRSRAVKTEEKPWEYLLYLKRRIYHLATEHKSLKNGKEGKTPAMKAGVCKMKRSVEEIFK